MLLLIKRVTKLSTILKKCFLLYGKTTCYVKSCGYIIHSKILKKRQLYFFLHT